MKNESSGAIQFLIVLLIGTIFTWASGLADLQYIDQSPVGFQHGFPGDISEWDAAGEQANIRITEQGIQLARVVAGRSYAKRTFDLPEKVSDEHNTIRVRAIITTKGKSPTNDEGKPASFMIWFLDEARNGINYLTVQSLTGDFREYRAERVVTVPNAARYAVVVLQNNESSGHFSLISASATFVSVSNTYRNIATILILFWLMLLSFSVYRCYRILNLWQTTALAVLAVLIISGILLPEIAMTDVVLPLFNSVISYLPFNTHITVQTVYKLGHFVFFFALSFVLLLNIVGPTLTRTHAVLILLLVAIATEGMQLHLYHRTSRMFDLSIDIAAIILALVMSSTLIRMRTTNTQKLDD